MGLWSQKSTINVGERVRKQEYATARLDRGSVRQLLDARSYSLLQRRVKRRPTFPRRRYLGFMYGINV